jgi:calcineurin-like phosphoesterase family protein
MNETLIENHNKVVRDKDYVVCLGDFTWSGPGRTIEILKRLKGKKHFTYGNHDKVMKKQELQYYMESIGDLHELCIQDAEAPSKKQYIICMHYAMRTWNKSHHLSYHCFGHSHGGLPDDPNSFSMDVGVDATATRLSENGILNPKDYRPISYDEVKAFMKNKNVSNRRQ